jgi:Pyruvate/2-oxoacid:ferredoxin oxidoreductase delta subunit
VRRARAGAERREGPQVRHRCYVCGKTDVSHPQLDFRYCSKCAGDQCYCPEHIRNHEHVLTDGDAKKS